MAGGSEDRFKSPIVRHQFLTLCIAVAVSSISYSMFPPLVPLFSLSLGASPALIGTIVSLAFLPTLFLAIPLGRLLDWWGATNLLRVGAAAMILAPLLLVALPRIWVLIAFQTVFGLAQLTVVVAAQALVASRSLGRNREQHYGWYTMAVSIGQFVGPLTAGLIIDRVSFQAAFFTASLIALLPFLAFMLFFGHDQGRPVRGSPPRIMPLGARALLLKSGTRIAMAASVGVLLGIAGFETFLPVYLDQLSFDGTTIGVLFSLRAFTTITVRPFLQQISRLFASQTQVLVVAVFVVATGLLVPTISNQFLAFAAMSVLLGLGSAVSQPISMAMMMDHVGEGERGLAVGLRLTANRVAQFLSPLLLGLLATASDVSLIFPAAAVAVVLVNLTLINWDRAAAQTSPSD